VTPPDAPCAVNGDRARQGSVSRPKNLPPVDRHPAPRHGADELAGVHGEERLAGRSVDGPAGLLVGGEVHLEREGHCARVDPRRVASEAARFEEFLVAFYTHEPQDDDLGSRNSVWRVALVVEGEGEELPVEIRPERADAQVRELYPFVGDFDTVYRVRFARWKGAPLAGRPFLLRIAGPEGRMEFRY